MRLLLWCPGCDDLHGVETVDKPKWSFDGDLRRPTIDPSIKVEGVQWAPDDGFYKPKHHVEPGAPIVCHSFVRQGRWEFLGDCTHELVGQIVDMVPVPEYVLLNGVLA